MDFDDAGVKSMYKAVRLQLCNVDKLAEAVLLASSVSQDKTACSQTARLGFEALTGGRSMKEDNYVKPVYFMTEPAATPPIAMDTTMPASPSSSILGATDMSSSFMPKATEEPTVTYVSLTGDDNDLFSDFDGHRFLILQCHNQVRMLQACKNECTVVGFAKEYKYAHAAATMTYDSFQRWWVNLIKALRTKDTKPVYNPNITDNKASMCVDTRGLEVEKVLGVPYGNRNNRSWFFQQSVQF